MGDDDDDDDDASWQLARQNVLVRLLGITVIRDIINAVFGTGGDNPLGSLRCGPVGRIMRWMSATQRATS